MAETDAPPIRIILTPPTGKDGLFIQPDDISPARETVEQHNRDAAGAHFKYADPFTGLTRTFDEAGDYNCGRCNQANGSKCLLIGALTIDRDAGSCGDWEDLCAGDFEMRRPYKTVETAVYGVAQNGMGFGCHRCPFASRAIAADSRGRDLYCGKLDCRVFANACCSLNGAPVVSDKADDEMEDANMPSVSLKQEHFMGMSGTAKGRKALRSYGMKPAPVSVAHDFNKADKGRHFTKRTSTAADIGRTK